MKFLRLSFLGPWLGVIGLFWFGLIDFRTVQLETYLLIFCFLISGILGLYISYCVPIIRPSGLNLYSRKFLNILLFLSLTFFISSALKMSELSQLVSFKLNLEGLTNLRYEKKSLDIEKGEFLTGIIARILAGFPILTFIYKEYYKSFISKRLQQLINLVGFLALLFSLLDGGRNSLVLMIFIYFLLSSRKIRIRLNATHEKKNFQKLLLGVLTLFVILSIFVVRGQRNEGSISNNISNFEKEYNIEINDYVQNQITSNESISSSIFYSGIFLSYYASHSIWELNRLYTSDFSQKPYFGAYQFYTFSMFFNKIGAEIKSIDDILDEIPNPGTYFSLIGALYLDFGTLGVFLCSFFFLFFLGRSYRKYQHFGQLKDLLVFVCFFSIIVFSPIFSIIGIGVFSPLIVSILFYLTFQKKIR